MTPADFPAADYTTAIVVGLIFFVAMAVAAAGIAGSSGAKRRLSLFLWITGTVTVAAALLLWGFSMLEDAKDRRNELISSSVEDWLQKDYGISTSIEVDTDLLDDPKIEGMKVSDGERMLTIVLEGGSSYALVDDDSRVVEPHQ